MSWTSWFGFRVIQMQRDRLMKFWDNSLQAWLFYHYMWGLATGGRGYCPSQFLEDMEMTYKE